MVKIADGIRPGGQTVDLRGAGRAVVDRMGLLDQMRACSLEQRGAAWVKADGRRRAEMPVEAFHGNGLVSQLEILRGDLVVGADGPHSAVRRLAFGPEEKFVKPLGGYHAWFTAPDTVGLDGWFLIYQAPGGLNASMRPSHDPAIAKAGLAFRSEPIEYDRRNLDEQRELLASRFAGAAAERPEHQPGAGRRVRACG